MAHDLSKLTKSQLLSYIASMPASTEHGFCVNVTQKYTFDSEVEAMAHAHSAEESGGYCQVRSGKFAEDGTWLKGAQVEVIYKSR